MRKAFIFFLMSILISIPGSILIADDLVFDSFEEAEKAAQNRAAEYDKKMEEHLQEVHDDWEQQQKDLGESDASPDITDITSSSDGQASSDSKASKGMEDAVDSSVNDLKDQMISNSGPNTTGFAGGGAGYQWKVKYEDGKYVLSDSYNEAAFGTGSKKDDEPGKEASGGDEVADAESAEANDPEPEEPAAPDPEPVAEPEPAPVAPPAEPDSTSVAKTPSTPAPSDSTPESSEGSSPSAPPATPPDEPAPGFDPAPEKLPKPAVRMVIQHPTNFREEMFSANADSDDSIEYELNKFKIPEDTRVKMQVEVADTVNPEDVSLVVTDEEGPGPEVKSEKLKNFRHMFRVPSDDKYSAQLYYQDSSTPGSAKKQLMRVKIPVSKVEFDSRTLDNQKIKQGGEGQYSSSTTSYSDSSAGQNRSNFGQSEQVDLSDLYSDPSASDSGSSSFSGSQSENEYASNQSYGSEDDNYGSSSTSSSDENGSSYSRSGSNSSASSSSGRSGSNNNYSSTGSSNSSGKAGSGSNVSAQGNQGNAYQSYGSNSGNNAANNQYATTSGSGSSSSGSSNGRYSSQGSSSSSGSSSNYGGSSSGGSSSGSSSNYRSDHRESDAYENQDYKLRENQDNKVKYDNNDASDDIQKNQGGVESEENQNEDSFIMALSMQSISNDIYQSFDFIENPSPTSHVIPAGSEVTFSMNFANDVDINSISIELRDGKEVISGDINTLGEAFAYEFKNPSNASFRISGSSSRDNFSYSLKIPVK
ncbi:MAG: hypothetical protein ACQETH_02075 [Candidatus Rifleibacteriota bacterium]